MTAATNADVVDVGRLDFGTGPYLRGHRDALSTLPELDCFALAQTGHMQIGRSES
jgi:hypothetical protein